MLDDKALVVVESIIFTNSLMSAIIQDSGKRERSNDIDDNISFNFIYYT